MQVLSLLVNCSHVLEIPRRTRFRRCIPSGITSARYSALGLIMPASLDALTLGRVISALLTNVALSEIQRARLTLGCFQQSEGMKGKA